MATRTNGAMSKSASDLPLPAAAMPASTCSVTRPVRSGLMKIGCTPSATSPAVRRPAGENAAV